MSHKSVFVCPGLWTMDSLTMRFVMSVLDHEVSVPLPKLTSNGTLITESQVSFLVGNNLCILSHINSRRIIHP